MRPDIGEKSDGWKKDTAFYEGRKIPLHSLARFFFKQGIKLDNI